MTPFTSGLAAGADLIDTDITQGPDGNTWFVDTGPPTAIGRADVQLAPKASTGAASAIGTATATIAGTVNPRGAPTTVSIQYGGGPGLGSTVSAGTLPASPIASSVSGGLSALPSGSTVFYRVLATNVYGTATGTIQSFKTAAVAPIAIPPKPSPPKPSATKTTTATLGNQRIALVAPLPSACTAGAMSLPITLTTSTIRHSRAARVRFVSASLFLDRGVRHTRHRTKRSHGKRVRVKVAVYVANRILRRLPAHPSLRLAGLRSGRHTLTVELRFRKHPSGPVRKTLRVHFRIC